MDGTVVMVLSLLSSVIAVISALFSFYISPKQVVQQTKKSEHVTMAEAGMSSEDIQKMLKSLREGHSVMLAAHHLEPMKIPPIEYHYNKVTDKKSGRLIVSSTI